MIITKIQKHAVKSLLEDSRFDVILKLYEEMLLKWKDESALGHDEFNTLKNTFTREGKIQGLKSFFELLDQAAQEVNK